VREDRLNGDLRGVGVNGVEIAHWLKDGQNSVRHPGAKSLDKESQTKFHLRDASPQSAIN